MYAVDSHRIIETSQYWEPEVQRTWPGRNLGPHGALTALSSELASESPKEGASGMPCGGQGQLGLLDLSFKGGPQQMTTQRSSTVELCFRKRTSAVERRMF